MGFQRGRSFVNEFKESFCACAGESHPSVLGTWDVSMLRVDPRSLLGSPTTRLRPLQLFEAVPGPAYQTLSPQAPSYVYVGSGMRHCHLVAARHARRTSQTTRRRQQPASDGMSCQGRPDQRRRNRVKCQRVYLFFWCSRLPSQPAPGCPAVRHPPPGPGRQFFYGANAGT